MTFEHIAGISLNYDDNPCGRQSTCYQTVLRFQMRLQEMFSNSISVGLMENYDKSAGVLITELIVPPDLVDS